MNLLLLLSLVAFVLGVGATVAPTSTPEKATSSNDVPQKTNTDDQAQSNSQDAVGDKIVTKRSYAWNPWSYVGYSYGWPWYGFGHGYPGGLYPALPLFYGHGYGGYGGYGGYLGYRSLIGHGYKGW